MFPGAPEPFVDLSTGINPNPYPVPALPADLFARLPDSAALARLLAAAATAYRAPSAAHLVPAPGTQILLPLIAGLVPPGRATVLAPTYVEHARAAALAGHAVTEVSDIGALGDAGLAILTNPNNPDGRLLAKDELIAVARKLQVRGGLARGRRGLHGRRAGGRTLPASLAGEVGLGNVVVLRSFGKFFGLAGLRLGFALAAPALVERIKSLLGPWAVSGPALADRHAGADRSYLDQRDAGSPRAGGEQTGCNPDRSRPRDCRRHDFVSAGAQPCGRETVSSSRLRGNIRPQISRSCRMAAFRPAGGGTGVAAAAECRGQKCDGRLRRQRLGLNDELCARIKKSKATRHR